MNNFFKTDKIFLGIIIGASIIGASIYFGIKGNNIVVAPKTPTVISDQKVGVKSDITPTIICGAENNTIVTKVIDGDTVVVEGGFHIRLLEMDADEKGYPCYEQAKTRLEELILSKQVKLEKDKTDLDQYGRCLRYVFLGDANIDVQLVKEGLAIARFYQPDVKYKTEIASAEKQAQENKVGCKWAQ